jgi:hypothetical protein
MDLFCPHCTRRVSVPEDKAGQVMSCPLCGKQFQAPALAPPPVSPAPPAPPPESSSSAAEPSRPRPAAPESAVSSEPPPPPGDFRRSLAICLKAAWLAFVPPICVIAIFLLSFFTWHSVAVLDQFGRVDSNLWSLAFSSSYGQAQFLAYVILMFPTGLLTVLSLPFDKGWIPAPPQLAPVLPFKNLVIGLLLALTFALLCIDYLSSHFGAGANPIALAMKIAFRLHFLALLASFGLFWVHWRARRNLPAPRVEMKW